MTPLLISALLLPAVSPPYFGIRVVDGATGRGVPLIELRTVNDIALVTDSGGWAAFYEPGLMGREVFFAVAGSGYEYPKDRFGYRGVRLVPRPGRTAAVKVTRTNVAERLYRITGQGVYRDSTLLGLPTPLPEPNRNAGVLGQDSVQAVPYRGKLFWLWGDTNLPNYPLGNFQTTAATSPLPGPGGFDPDTEIPLKYFTDPTRPDRVRRMVPLKEPGVVWLFGLLTVPDADGREALLAHYSRRKGLAEELEHGIVRFDDTAGVFTRVKTLDLKETWRFPRGNAVRVTDAAGDYFYFASPFPHTRVKVTWDSLLDPTQYESLAFDPAAKGYSWQRATAPTTQADERKLIEAGALPAAAARYQVTDAATGKPVQVHGGSVAWNEYRKKWVLIALELWGKDSPSLLGEVWYAEADAPTGPWGKAAKVASHPKYSFYNPRQHPFFAKDGGRVIYFEGTYTHTFSGNPTPTPRYDYNQILYRLDLADERLVPARR